MVPLLQQAIIIMSLSYIPRLTKCVFKPGFLVSLPTSSRRAFRGFFRKIQTAIFLNTSLEALREYIINIMEILPLLLLVYYCSRSFCCVMETILQLLSCSCNYKMFSFLKMYSKPLSNADQLIFTKVNEKNCFPNADNANISSVPKMLSTVHANVRSNTGCTI
jgi:hypothetical protein